VLNQRSVGLVAGKRLVQRSQGFAVAEFAIVLPAVVFVAAMVISMLGITVTQIQLESAAAHGARIIGRGDPIPDSYRNSLPRNTTITATPNGEIVEVTLHTNYDLGPSWLSRHIELAASARARLEPVFEEFG
jgi:Flp pilus assembly protein TadG